jgi:hypothetical protein
MLHSVSQIDNLILKSDTDTMNALTDQPEKDLVWQKTPYVNLLRPNP